MLFLARIVRLVANVVAAIIVVGILLFVFEADRGNDLVAAVFDAAKWLIDPFAGLFSIDNRKTELAVNWGIAAAIYWLAGMLIARLLARLAIGTRGDRTHWWHRRRGVHA